MTEQNITLTEREKEVIYYVCEGKSNGEISHALSLSQRTIENYRMRIAKKTGANCTAKVVVFAIKMGIYVP